MVNEDKCVNCLPLNLDFDLSVLKKITVRNMKEEMSSWKSTTLKSHLCLA